MSSSRFSLDNCTSADPNVLFNDSLLKELDYSECPTTVAYGVSYLNPGSCNSSPLIARPLERKDYDKGYIPLLAQLTAVGDYTKELFERQFDGMKQMPGTHLILVVEDPDADGCGKIVANASLVVERKFVHQAALRGRIEDVVVDENYRGKHLGSMLLESLKLLSQALRCYKLTLDCKEAMVPYYSKLGYVNEGQYFLTQRFFY